MSPQREPGVVPNILQGVVIGLTIAVLIGLYDQGKDWLDRREQVRYIRAFLVEGVNKTCETTDPKTRSFYYLKMLVDLKSALSIRSDGLSYDEKKELLDLLPFDEFGRPYIPKVNPVDAAIITKTFEQLKGVTWAKIPSESVCTMKE